MAGTLVVGAVTTAAIGQPTVDDRWRWIAPEATHQLDGRDVYVTPAEVVDLRKDLSLRVDILDVRDEADFNRFHLRGARRVEPDRVTDPGVVRALTEAGENAVVFVVSNGETRATRVWKELRAQGVVNLYIVEGGINGWLEAFPPAPCVATRVEEAVGKDALAWRFGAAVGDRIPSAHPERPGRDPAPACAHVGPWRDHHDHEAPPYQRKVKLQKKTVAKGGCG